MPSIMQDIKSLNPLLIFFIFEPPYLALMILHFFFVIIYVKSTVMVNRSHCRSLFKHSHHATAAPEDKLIGIRDTIPIGAP